MNTTTPVSPSSSKTILFSGSDLGGVGKTFNNIQLGDALEALGYRVAYVDACKGSKSMRDIVPSARVVDLSNHSSLGKLFVEFSDNDSEDIMIIDIGPSQTGVLKEFLRYTESAFHRLGLKTVIGISINADPESIKCAIPWVETLAVEAELITFVNHASPIPFDIEYLPAGDILLEVSENRVIHFDKLSTEMLSIYYACRGKASEYLQGGPLAEALHLDPVESKSWEEYRTKTIKEVYPLAKWLTGKEVENTPFSDYSI
jgi:hypothetical protein